jgi:hypothetical protein
LRMVPHGVNRLSDQIKAKYKFRLFTKAFRPGWLLNL